MGGLPVSTFKPLDINALLEEIPVMTAFIADYYKDIETYPVRSQVEPGYLRRLLPDSAPRFPEPLTTILDDVRNDILPGLTHWLSPNFFAYFPGSASNPGILGEMLSAALNVVGFNWISSPAATELEMVVMDWMAKFLRLPREFTFSGGGGGVLLGTTCEAIVCTMAAARDAALARIGFEGITKLVIYASDQTHFAFQKASKLVGIPPANFRVIVTSTASEHALPPESVRAAIDEDLARGLVPLYICATVGTTAVGAVDPLAPLGDLAREYGVWLHVDAAYAGACASCVEYGRYFEGLDRADSFSTNCHKWLLSNLDCCCLWVKNPGSLVSSLSTDAEILKNDASEAKQVVDYKDWQISLSRRFRALKLWLVMRRFGADNLMSHIRSDVEMAEQFERMVEMDERFEVVVPRRFALVCFRLRPKKGGPCEMNRKLLEAVNASGRAFMTHAVVEGKYVLRMVVGATLTEERHVYGTWKVIQDMADGIVSEEYQ
ncbi:Tyrosine/DOPA decarboxylase 1 [Acorus calamus]|uniref:Tyrosine/DOPA decarboxylase 1 n=1 Tax=Acorus calamus TaxID=4465 RepID=A0AAV9FJ23_ACOCL|nr:Tyrosine/DOPA decarboxylase 1 [Acorus calamus]